MTQNASHRLSLGFSAQKENNMVVLHHVKERSFLPKAFFQNSETCHVLSKPNPWICLHTPQQDIKKSLLVRPRITNIQKRKTRKHENQYNHLLKGIKNLMQNPKNKTKRPFNRTFLVLQKTKWRSSREARAWYMRASLFTPGIREGDGWT